MTLPYERMKVKTCTDCGRQFRTVKGYRFCSDCRPKHLAQVYQSGYLTPWPRFRPRARPGETGVIQ